MDTFSIVWIIVGLILFVLLIAYCYESDNDTGDNMMLGLAALAVSAFWWIVLPLVALFYLGILFRKYYLKRS